MHLLNCESIYEGRWCVIIVVKEEELRKWSHFCVPDASVFTNNIEYTGCSIDIVRFKSNKLKVKAIIVKHS